MMEKRPICDAMVEIANLANRLGVKAYELQATWEHQIDDQWWISLNSHKVPKINSHGIEVSPYHCYVEFDGWPAGTISPFDGVFVEHANANEDAFIAALKNSAPNKE